MSIPVRSVLFLLLTCFWTVSCTTEKPATILQRAQGSWAAGEEKKACEAIDRLPGAALQTWPRRMAYEYLRFTAMCSVSRGKPLPSSIAELPKPWGMYAQAMFQFHSGQPQNAALKLRSLLSLDQDREPAFRLGMILLLDEQFDEACGLLESALEDTRMRQPGVRLALARCRIGKGQLDGIADLLRPLVHSGNRREINQARQILQLARSWNRLLPPEPMKALSHVRTLLRAEEPAAALDELEKVMQNYQNFALLHYLRGVIHLRLGNRPDAVVELENALRLEPGDPEALLLLGNIYFHAQRNMEARKYLSEAIERNPFLTQGYRLLRDLHTRDQAFTLAVQAHDSFMKLSRRGDSHENRTLLAELQEKASLFPEALKTHTSIIRQMGDEEGFSSLLGSARIHLALAQENLNQAMEHRKKARRFLERAEKIRSTDPELARLSELLHGPKKRSRTDFEKKLRTRGGKTPPDDSNLFD